MTEESTQQQLQVRDSIDDRNGSSEIAAVVLLSLTAMGAGILSAPCDTVLRRDGRGINRFRDFFGDGRLL